MKTETLQRKIRLVSNLQGLLTQGIFPGSYSSIITESHGFLEKMRASLSKQFAAKLAPSPQTSLPLDAAPAQVEG